MTGATATGAVSWAEAVRTDMRPYPGRWNITFRCLLSCAICIVASMVLQVPFLGAISLFVVFYATQSNIVMARLVGFVMLLGITLALGIAILLLKFTIENPPLRIVLSMAMIFVCLFLMRATKLGPVFYLIALMLAVSQTFFDIAPSGELMVRGLLWAAVAAIYPLAVSVLVNTLLIPGEPLRQLKDEAHRQMRQLDGILAHAAGAGPAVEPLKLEDIQQGVLSGHKLLRFAWMRDKVFEQQRGRHLAVSATVSSLREQAARLQRAEAVNIPPASILAIRTACRRLDNCIEQETPFDLEGIEAPEETGDTRVDTMWRVLRALADRGEVPEEGEKAKKQLFVEDAFTNPVYIRFALKTVLAMVIAYLFYSGTDWTGIKTAMTTCLIVAQPSLGASNHKIHLRILGASLGGLVALVMTIVLVPHLEGIVGLLLMSLPVYGLAAYISAGSERTAYAGLQLMYTFGLVMLGTFWPSTDLSNISDRLIGIAIGIALSYVIQTLLWPETENQPLARKIGTLLKSIATYIARPADPDSALARPAQSAKVWEAYNDCEETQSRMAFEPGWKQGEGEHENVNRRARQLTAHAREILLAAGAFGTSLDSAAARLTPAERDALAQSQQAIAERLNRYADALIQSGNILYKPEATQDNLLPAHRFAAAQEHASLQADRRQLVDSVNRLVGSDPDDINAPEHAVVPT